jgi:hypothetical protein
MVAVLMRNQHRIDVFRLLANLRQTARQILYTQTRVNQHTRLRRT